RAPNKPEMSTGALAGSILSFGPTTLPSFVMKAQGETSTALVGLELTKDVSINYSDTTRDVARLTYTFKRG
ncbi:MAG: hypothetical protein RR505_04315, partial [Raoultibacter sp.]